MNPPILERSPGDPRKKEVNPLLKLALELGPLMVFFFANARGEWLAGKFPALAAFGGPIFIATALFMIATAIALTASWYCSALCRSCRWCQASSSSSSAG